MGTCAGSSMVEQEPLKLMDVGSIPTQRTNYTVLVTITLCFGILMEEEGSIPYTVISSWTSVMVAQSLIQYKVEVRILGPNL
jgi:hypothetical protein